MKGSRSRSTARMNRRGTADSASGQAYQQHGLSVQTPSIVKSSSPKGMSVHSEYCLEATGANKSFFLGRRRVIALDDFSARVKKGMVTGLIGPDGAGKTTFMRMAVGLLIPDKGRIICLGMDTSRDSLEVQAAIGYMPQRFGLYEDLTVQENLDLYADLQGVPNEVRPGRYRELMRMTGLGPFTRRLAGRLSGGMKQKLGLACTLIKPPALLILDEPTVGVDPLSRRELWHIVYRQVEEEGMSVLLSTSYLDEAERCQDVILIHEGRFLGQDEPHVFSKALEGHSFILTPSRGDKRRLQEVLSERHEVIDALILGEKVRLVTRDAMEPQEVKRCFQVGVDFDVQVVEPRFEDAFISLLKRKKEGEGEAELHHAITPSMVRGSRDEEVIAVKDLKRKFGNFYAVKGIDFTVKRGEIFGLLGANGAGKSTTFRMLCGLLPASSGELRVAGHNLRRARAKARAKIGYMAQRFSLYGGLTVYQNLRFFSSAYGLRGKRQRQRIGWALESFDLSGLKDARSGTLPLGYKQRLALAVALMHEPEILFLDEPTSGVDPLARREFWRHINALAEANVTVMVTTHFMEEAEYCDRMVIMAQGEILAAGTPEEMKARFRSPENPDPTMEDAFIALIEMHGQEAESA